MSTRKLVSIGLALALGLLVWAPRAMGETTWTIQTVDRCASNSLALDPGEGPRIAYYDMVNADVKYAAWNRHIGSWEIQVVDSAGDVGRFVSLALYNGQPRVTYLDQTNLCWWYAAWDGSAWAKSLIGPGWGGNNNIVLDTEGNPRLTYPGPNHELMYWDGQTSTPIDTTGQTIDTSIALRDGKPSIAYGRGGNELWYAALDGSGWTYEKIDVVGSVRSETSIAVGADGRVHVAVPDRSTPGDHNLKYAVRDAAGWHLTMVDEEGYVGDNPSLALGSDDRPRIAYCGRDFLTLMYAEWNGSAWDRQKVADAGNCGGGSLKLDCDDQPWISFCGDSHGADGNLKLASPIRASPIPEPAFLGVIGIVAAMGTVWRRWRQACGGMPAKT